MALIKCPECGKENVSDSAPTCPECGFAIREHFEKMEKARLAKEQEVERKKQAELQKQREIENKKQLEQRRLNSVPKPEKPKFGTGYIISFNIVLLIGLVFLVEGLIEAAFVDGCIFFGCFLVVDLTILGTGFYDYHQKQLKYKLSLSDFNEYRRQVLKKQNFKIVNKKSSDLEELNNVPKCPTCSSTSVRKITSTERAINFGLFGLLGNKRKFQFECKNCDYKW